MHTAKSSFALILAVVLMGCGHDKATAPSDANSAYLTQPYWKWSSVLGWFVESDGKGHSGYQAAYTASSSATPETLPLYRSISEFRVALQTKGMTNFAFEPIAGYTNSVWAIRGLNRDELKELREELKKPLRRQVAGESTNKIPVQFRFITTNTTLQQVVGKLGKYDRVRGSGIQYYEYDLSGGSAVLILTDSPFRLTNNVRSVIFFKSTNEIYLNP